MAERVTQTIYDWDDPTTKCEIPRFIQKHQLSNDSYEYDDRDELKFWRRRDILIPHQPLEIDSTIYTINMLSHDDDDDFKKMSEQDGNLEEVFDFWKEMDYRESKTSNDLMERCIEPLTRMDEEGEKEEVIEKKEMYLNENDRCFYLGSMLNYSFECRELIYASDRLGFTSIENEYPPEYRNSERVLIKSKKFADLIWKRIKLYFKPDDFKGVKPYGFNNDGVWVPVGLNECFRFNKYENRSFFKPHQDAKFVKNDNEQSIFTVLIYLDCSTAPTVLLKRLEDQVGKKKKQQHEEVIQRFKKLTLIRPQTGGIAIFNHDLYHAGAIVYDAKYVIRTEMIFKRVDALPSPIMDYKLNEKYLRIKNLLVESSQLEKEGKIKESTTLYLKAHELYTSESKSTTEKKSISFIEEILSDDVLGNIFLHLTPEDLVKSIILLNRNFYLVGKSNYIWKAQYKNKFGFSDFQTDDWYQEFISRCNLDKFFSPLLVNLDIDHVKYALSDDKFEFNQVSSGIGIPNHNHFYIDGYGYEDYSIDESFCKHKNFLSIDGKIKEEKYFKVFFYELYKKVLGIKLKEHPLVLCHPLSWNDQDKQIALANLFSIGIPHVLFTTNPEMVYLQMNQTMCLMTINIGASGVTCSLVKNGKLEDHSCAIVDMTELCNNFGIYIDVYDDSEDAPYWRNTYNYIPAIASYEQLTNYQKFEQSVDHYSDRNYCFEVTSQTRILIGYSYLKNILPCIESMFNKHKDSVTHILWSGFSDIGIENLQARLRGHLLKDHPNVIEISEEYYDEPSEGVYEFSVLVGMKSFATVSNMKKLGHCNPILLDPSVTIYSQHDA